MTKSTPKPIIIVPDDTAPEICEELKAAGYVVVPASAPESFRVISSFGFGVEPEIYHEALRIIDTISGEGSRIALARFIIKFLRDKQ